jgi:hypothetical protein
MKGNAFGLRYRSSQYYTADSFPGLADIIFFDACQWRVEPSDFLRLRDHFQFDFGEVVFAEGEVIAADFDADSAVGGFHVFQFDDASRSDVQFPEPVNDGTFAFDTDQAGDLPGLRLSSVIVSRLAC